MDDFWDDAKDVVCVRSQPKIAVYMNTTGYITIRQKSENDELLLGDPAIFILPEYVNDVVAALLKIKEELGNEVV